MRMKASLKFYFMLLMIRVMFTVAGCDSLNTRDKVCINLCTYFWRLCTCNCCFKRAQILTLNRNYSNVLVQVSHSETVFTGDFPRVNVLVRKMALFSSYVCVRVYVCIHAMYVSTYGRTDGRMSVRMDLNETCCVSRNNCLASYSLRFLHR